MMTPGMQVAKIILPCPEDSWQKTSCNVFRCQSPSPFVTCGNRKFISFLGQGKEYVCETKFVQYSVIVFL